MKRTITSSFCFLALITLITASCTKESPKPGKPVTFATVCSNKYNPVMEKGLSKGPRVSIEGYMELSGMFSLQSSTLLITLFSEPGRKGEALNISLKVGNDANEIERLPKKYRYSDLNVHTKDDKVVGQDRKVRVHGMRLGKDRTCYIKVDLVEAI